jgi:hypothetical protein
MKNLITFILVCVSTTTMAADFTQAPSDPFQSMGLSSSCAKRIIAAGIAYCNNESLKQEGSERMNECIEPQSDIATGGQYSGMLEVSGTAGDADSYWYAVQIEGATNCKYKLISEQPGQAGS